MNSSNSANPIESLEMQEIIEKLRESGHEDLVNCLLDFENECYTKKGRLNKSATTRKMGWKSKQLEDSLREMREVLKNEFNIDGEDEDDDEEES